MKLVIATDHQGTEKKLELIERLKGDYEIIDASPENTPTDDFPDFAFKVADMVVEKEADYGILLCGTGIGMSIAANKVKGAVCALISDEHDAEYAKKHNDANIISMKVTRETDELEKLIRIFLKAEPDMEEKYERRRKKILDYEVGKYR